MSKYDTAAELVPLAGETEEHWQSRVNESIANIERWSIRKLDWLRNLKYAELNVRPPRKPQPAFDEWPQYDDSEGIGISL